MIQPVNNVALLHTIIFLQREHVQKILDYFNRICMQHLVCMKKHENKQEHMLREPDHSSNMIVSCCRSNSHINQRNAVIKPLNQSDTFIEVVTHLLKYTVIQILAKTLN